MNIAKSILIITLGASFAAQMPMQLIAAPATAQRQANQHSAPTAKKQVDPVVGFGLLALFMGYAIYNWYMDSYYYDTCWMCETRCEKKWMINFHSRNPNTIAKDALDLQYNRAELAWRNKDAKDDRACAIADAKKNGHLLCPSCMVRQFKSLPLTCGFDDAIQASNSHAFCKRCTGKRLCFECPCTIRQGETITDGGNVYHGNDVKCRTRLDLNWINRNHNMRQALFQTNPSEAAHLWSDWQAMVREWPTMTVRMAQKPNDAILVNHDFAGGADARLSHRACVEWVNRWENVDKQRRPRATENDPDVMNTREIQEHMKAEADRRAKMIADARRRAAAR